MAVTLLVVLDFEAAFDTIDSKIFTDTLASEFDVIGNALKSIESFSSRRKHRIKRVNMSFLPTIRQTVGPQGSFLGKAPFLCVLTVLRYP